MRIGNRTSRLAGEPGLFVKQYGRNARKHLDPNDTERAMRRLSTADLPGLPADDVTEEDQSGVDSGPA
ncbi:TPA: hypothetical protein ACT5B7_002175 [Burkholderia cenocepacia]|uniref:hypothetical protein n=1 Tax=Burkholderia cenocepacia TaxID=95486 RepID=UPI00078C5C49|nr:hypothetical protein [Burkholderia cenocepacia]AMU09268.1 hypothetical protein A2T82_23720 [Burkholderia cenocepacia]